MQWGKNPKIKEKGNTRHNTSTDRFKVPREAMNSTPNPNRSMIPRSEGNLTPIFNRSQIFGSEGNKPNPSLTGEGTPKAGSTNGQGPPLHQPILNLNEPLFRSRNSHLIRTDPPPWTQWKKSLGTLGWGGACQDPQEEIE